jgi:hypothetical protein
MSNQNSFGLETAVSSVVLVLLGLAVAVRLLPLLLQVLWQLVPAVIVLWFIVSVLRGIVNKLFN